MTPEGQVLRSILDYLSAKKIWHKRINTGRRGGVSYGSEGMGDIIASPKLLKDDWCVMHPVFLWLEVKTMKGKQSESQKKFQSEVEAEGHYYLLARSIGDVERFLQEHSA